MDISLIVFDTNSISNDNRDAVDVAVVLSSSLLHSGLGSREVAQEGTREGAQPWGNLSGLSNICAPDQVRLQLAALAAIAIPSLMFPNNVIFDFLVTLAAAFLR